MSGAWLWARREIMRGWVSLLIVVLLVSVTGGAVMAGVAGARRAGASVDRFLADSGLPGLSIYTESPIDSQLRAELEADDRIAAIGDTRVMLATPTSVEPGLGGATLVLPDEFWGDLVRPRLIDGKYPSAPNEIAATEAANRLGFDVGETVDMHMLTYSAVDVCRNGGTCTPIDAGETEVTGVVRLDSDLAPGPFGQAMFLAPAAFLETRGGADSTFGYITFLFSTPEADLDAIVTEYSTRIDNGDITSASSAETEGAQRAARLQRDALLIGTMIAAAAGLLITGQAFGRFLARRSSDAPALAAIGMGTAHRILAGWLPGLGGALAGTILAIPAAIALSPLFPLRMARRADPDIGIHADWTVIAVGSTALLVVAASAALISAVLWSATTHSTGAARSVSSVAKLAQRLRLTPTTTMGSRFALEPGRGPKRTPVVPSLVGASAAVVVVVGAAVLTISLDGLLATSAQYGAPWDLQVSAGDSFEDAGRLIAADERVEGVAVAVTGELNASFGGSTPMQGSAIGIKAIKGTVEPVVLEGRTPNGSNEVMVGSNTLKTLGLGIGDQLEVSGPGGSETMVAVGRTIIPVIGNDSPNNGIVVSLEMLESLGGTQTVADIDVEGVILVSVFDPDDVESIGRDIEESGAMLDGPFRPSTVAVLDEVRGIPVYVAVFTSVIGALAVFHTLFVTSRRRRADLAVIRALGCRPRQARGVIHWQGFFVALAALAIGIPIGLIGGRLLWQSIAERTNVVSVIATPWSAIAFLAVAATAGATLLLATGPAWTASRRSPGADLRAE